ncbi:PKD domain-containing protein [Flaviaesturariibacter flavus]|uniref:PKD domain-containing protein n=1 Tax=Flaviaesturariibacter flavus TaxID=2502780 RepID=A0A4R1BA23_9BACT|nr:PKD domain-containing protein [Flaviaesturariibacter flavus]TCJ13779.1 PKD domain-containing protein [Flaviaesturariibacter flavus]
MRNLTNRIGVLLIALTFFAIVPGARAQGRPKARTASLSAGFAATVTSGCAPLLVRFQDVSTGGATQWHWELGNGVTSTQQNPATLYNLPGTYSVRLVVRNSSGADSVLRSGYIRVTAAPAVRFELSDSVGCLPFALTLRDYSTSDSAIVGRAWDFGDGTLGSGMTAQHLYHRAGTYSVTLKVTNSAGCSSSFTKTAAVRVSESPVAGFTAADPTRCAAPHRVQFNANGSGLQYRWDFGDGTSATGAQPAHTYTAEGSYSVRLVVTNAAGCSDTLLRTDLVRIGADASFSAPDSICAGRPLGLINSSSPAPAQQLWDFGNGNTSGLQQPVTSFQTPGIYTIRLINHYGDCADTAERRLTVLPAPVAAFRSADTVSCSAPFSVAFQNNSTGAAGQEWDFGDGTRSTEDAPVHIYSAPGHYTVRLVVRSSGGCTDTLVRYSYIKVQLPDLRIAGLPQSGCAPLTIWPTATVVGDSIRRYDWDFGDGTRSTSAAPGHVYVRPGIYDLRLTATTASGCVQTQTISAAAQAFEKPRSSFTFTPPVSCAFAGVAFQNTSSGVGAATAYNWSFGDGSTSPEASPSHTYGNIGLFSVQLIVANGTCTDTVSLRDTVRILAPIAVMAIEKNCDNRYERSFRDRSVGALTWHWDFGDGQTSTVQHPRHTYAAAGTYLVKLRVTNGTCYFETSDAVEIIDEKAHFVRPSAPVCKGMPYTLQADGIRGNRIAGWKWEMGDGTTYQSAGLATHSYTRNGSYRIMLTITDLNGCTSTYSDSITVIGPEAAFTVTDPLLCLQPGGSTARFEDHSVPYAGNPILQYSWNFGDGGVDSSGNRAPANRYTARGAYTVSLTVRDAAGCVDTRTMPSAVRVARPVAAFISADTSTCLQRDVDFENRTAGDGPLRFEWSFGDGSNSSQEAAQHRYSATGFYSIQLRVTDHWGCADTSTRDNYIRISVPKARFSMSDTTATCPPLQVQFGNSSTDYLSQQWDFGNGNGSALAAPAHLYNTAGVFHPRLVVTGPGGCADTLVRTVIVKGPSGTIQYDPVSGCSPLGVSFTASTRNRDSLVWDFGDGALHTGLDSLVQHTYRDTGSFLPRLLLFDRSGCSVVINGTDSLHSYRLFPALAADSRSLCDSGTVRFQGLSTGNDRISGWFWEFGDGATSVLQNPAHRYTRPGTYDVRLTNRGAQGCEATSVAFRVQVHASPKVGINLTRAAACVPALFPVQGRILRADTTILEWSWSLGDGRNAAGSIPAAFTYTTPGSYPLSLQVRDANGCTAGVSDTVLARALPAVDAGADFVLCRDSSRRLQARGAQTWSWSASPSLDCSNCANPRVTAPQTTRYYVTGTDAFGCSNRDSVLVTVQQRLPVQLLSRPDSLCLGRFVTLRAAGAERYEWSPATGLDAPFAASTTAKPERTTTYTVVGRDNAGCFADTARVTLTVFPIPQVTAGPDLELRAGDTATLRTSGSADITSWRWTPSGQLSCSTCPQPVVKAGYSSPLRVIVRNGGGCTATSEMKFTVTCNGGNVFLPNTFSPNADGMNERFFPRGKGLAGIRSFRVFNRWGEVVYERLHFNANDPAAGWDGTFRGKPAPADVYVYTCEVLCSSNEVLPLKGDVNLIR